MEVPVYVDDIYETGTKECTSLADCTHLINSIRNHQMKTVRQIGHNIQFFIGGDEKVYQRRGWFIQQDVVDEYSSRILSIAMIGTFVTYRLSKKMADLAKRVSEAPQILGNNRKAYLGLTKEIATWPAYLPKIIQRRIAEKSYVNNHSEPISKPVLQPGLRFINRSEWGAAPHIGEYDPLHTPVPYVIIHHTATSRCDTIAECKKAAINIQRFHMESFGWDDIGYNFMVGGDGYAYEARGWTNLGAHARGYNNVSIGIAFIGTFTNYLPTKYQIEEAQELIKEGLRLGYIKENYKLVGMNQVSTFESPGKKLIKEIKTWPHFAEKP